MKLKNDSKALNISIILICICFMQSVINTGVYILQQLKYNDYILLARLLPTICGTIISICFYVLYLIKLCKAKNGGEIACFFDIFKVAILIGILQSIVLNIYNIICFQETRVNILSVIILIYSIFMGILKLFGIKVLFEEANKKFLRNVLIIGIILSIIIHIIQTAPTVSIMIQHPSTFNGHIGIVRYILNNLISLLCSNMVSFAIVLMLNNLEISFKGRKMDDLQEDNIAKNVLLSIITFGVYGYIWLYKISRNIKCLKNDNSSLTGELLCLLFVPFYMLYWIYTREKAIKAQADCRNIQMSDNAALYLVLSLLGLSIVSVALMQNDLNTVISNKEKPIIQEKADINFKQENNNVEILKQLAKLKDDGILTEEEYQTKKQEVIDRI